MIDEVVRQHAAQIAHLEGRLKRLARDVEDLAGIATPAGSPPPDVPTDRRDSPRGPEAGTDLPGALVFPDVDDWVCDYFTPTFQRPFGGELRWCVRWRSHPEAVLRLEAMWRAWEALHPDAGLGLSVWLVTHFDPNFTVLTSRAGPFSRCSAERHAS